MTLNLAGNPFGDLEDFKPDTPAVKPTPSSLAVQTAAEESGFYLNNYPVRPIAAVRRKTMGPPIVNKTFRIYIADANRFQKWLNESGYTQKEGFAILTSNLPPVVPSK